jgi:uncharacterized protein (TIGR02328 family)
MRLWHEELIPYLPDKQLLGQHRECCALRGNGWGRKHSVVDYVFIHPYEDLYRFHMLVIEEMDKRGYIVENKWRICSYRGKNCEEYGKNIFYNRDRNIYNEHNQEYLYVCINNLTLKKSIPIGKNSWEDVLCEITKKNTL